MDLRHSITYRIAVGPQQGRKVMYHLPIIGGILSPVHGFLLISFQLGDRNVDNNGRHFTSLVSCRYKRFKCFITIYIRD